MTRLPLAPLLALLPPREMNGSPEQSNPPDIGPLRQLVEAVIVRAIYLGKPPPDPQAVEGRIRRAIRAGGATPEQADQWAVALGLTPDLVWGDDWWDGA